MNASENPYASPESVDASDRDCSKSLVVDFGPILLRWERLRLYYNGILITAVLLLTSVVFPNLFLEVDFWGCVVVGGVISNLCFFSGPLIEGYGRFFCVWNDMLTILLFLAGLIFTALMAIASLTAYLGPSITHKLP